MNTFKNKVAFVTGAGSGIGRAVAVQLAQAGATVAIADINAGELELTRAAIAEASGCEAADNKVTNNKAPAAADINAGELELTRDAIAEASGCEAADNKVTNNKAPAAVSLHAVDVADRHQVAACAAAVKERHGRLNLLINNAGVALTADTADVSYDDMHWLMSINYWGVVHGCKEFLPLLLSSGTEDNSAHIVNISSVFGLMAVPSQSAYNSSKFAVRGFSEALRLELHNQPVDVSTAFPAGIKTNIARNGRSNVTSEAEKEQRLKASEHLFNNTAERAAKDILAGVLRNEPRIMVGQGARRIDWFTRLAPKWVSERVIKTVSSLER